MPNGQIVQATGIVTHPQRPETAKGTIFVVDESALPGRLTFAQPDFR